MIDRFNNPARQPNNLPFDAKFGDFQGGTLQGVRERLGYIKSPGAGAIWMTPVFQNPVWKNSEYHGYGYGGLDDLGRLSHVRSFVTTIVVSRFPRA